MTALDQGSFAPDFTLQGVGGESFSLEILLQGKGALLAFFKTECPTCQLAMPFIERLYRRLQGSTVGMLAIGQNDKGQLQTWIRDYGLTIPIAIELPPYDVSNRFGLTTVPTLFLLRKDRAILRNLVGHSKTGLETIWKEAAELAGLSASEPLFTQADAAVKDFQPG